MKVDITTDQAILLIAMLEEQIPKCRPEIESEFLGIKSELLLSLVGSICNKHQPQ